MRPALSLGLLLCGLTSVARASDCVDGSCDVDGCTDGRGRAYVTSYEGKPLREPIPLPKPPGPHRCVIQPAKKEIKKTVYETKLVPYCLPNPYCGDCCRDDCNQPCPTCEKCVRWKKVVVKREIVVDTLCCYECVAVPCYAECEHTAVGLPPTPADANTPPAPPAAKP